MAIMFSTIGAIEHEYAFESAIAGADTFNGAFGTVTAGTFSVAADAAQAIMNVEVGDNAGLDTYPIAKGSDLRVVDLAKLNGKTMQIYGDALPDGVAVGDKLKSDATGKLVKGATKAPYYEVTKVIPNTKGVEVTLNTVVAGS